MAKTGLALSGGGVRGLAHLGVWKALQENKVNIDLLAGTSAGSLVGAFISSGFEAEQVLRLFERKGIFDFARVRIPSRGLMELRGLHKFLESELPYNRLEDLPIPLTVTVSEIKTGEVHYLSEGPLAQVLTASSCIPVLFSPIEMNNGLYVDGGLFDNLPTTPIRKKCDYLIAVNATPSGQRNDIKNIFDITQRVFELGASSEIGKGESDLLIEPMDLLNIPLLDGSKGNKAFELGYKAAVQALDKANTVS